MADHDIIVEEKKCPHCNENFTITQSDRDFYDKISPKFGDYTATIPNPTLCPDCRQRRRLSFRNERKLYRRICDATQQPIISIYNPAQKYTVYDQKIWRGDSWDPFTYDFDFDFNHTFKDQFSEILQRIPYANISAIWSEWCQYSQVANSQNCYLSFVWGWNTHTHYSHRIINCNKSLDLYRTTKTENSYQCILSNNLHSCFFSYYCTDSNNLSYCIECNNCSDCFLCSWLNNKKYCILNKQYTKEEYNNKIKHIQNPYTKYKHILETYNIQQKNKQSHNSSGDFLSHCTNTHDSQFINDAQDCKYCYDNIWWYTYNYDCSYGKNNTLWYESLLTSWSKNLYTAFCYDENNYSIHYSHNCFSCSHIFGCVWLRNKSYCILNKQYTKEEYNKLVPQIIEKMKADGERGEFFHPSLSPFGYNETVAMEHHPLTKQEAITLGYNWSDYESPAPQSDKVIPGEKLPSQWCDIINQQKPEFLQDIVRYAIQCEVSKQLFKLQPTEIQFYIKHNIPLPRKHPDVRHMERMQLRK